MITVFVSWSGSLSRSLAETLKDWLPIVVPEAKPWFSPKNIEKGRSWWPTIFKALKESHLSISCVTKQNVKAPWLHFEAGAIALADPLVATDDERLACALLFGILPNEIAGTPLGQLQATIFEREDMLLLVKSINNRLPQKHNESHLEVMFEKHWPKLEEKVNSILANQPVDESPAVPRKSSPPPLSTLARQILMGAVSGRRHTVHMSNAGGQFTLMGGDTAIINELGNDRREAEGRAAVKELLRCNLVEDRYHNMTNLPVTPDGYAFADQLRNHHERKDQLGAFLLEAQRLTERLNEDPLPIGDHNAWVDGVSRYLREHFGAAHEVRFSDFSGMIFYGDGSDRSKMSRSLDGRSRRLHEFISELESRR